MRILFLNGSPREKGSTSAYLLGALQQKLPGADIGRHSARREAPTALAASAPACGALVLALPLYVDGIPAHLLAHMQALEPLLVTARARPRVYAIANCGFYEGRQTHLALDMVEVWAQACGLPPGQAIGLGGGAMAQAAPVGRGPSANIGRALEVLAGNILAGRPGARLYVQPNFPRFLYKAAAHISWRQTAKKNGLRPGDLRAKPAGGHL